MPFEVAGNVIVEVNSKAGIALAQISVGEIAPGIFTINGLGTGDAAALDALSYAPITAAQPVAAGGYIALYCTGLGAVSPAAVTGAAPSGPPPQTIVKPALLLDGQPVSVLWAGLAPGFVGLYQVNAQVPANLKPGSHQLQLVANGASSNTVTLPVR